MIAAEICVSCNARPSASRSSDEECPVPNIQFSPTFEVKLGMCRTSSPLSSSNAKRGPAKAGTNSPKTKYITFYLPHCAINATSRALGFALLSSRSQSAILRSSSEILNLHGKRLTMDLGPSKANVEGLERRLIERNHRLRLSARADVCLPRDRTPPSVQFHYQLVSVEW